MVVLACASTHRGETTLLRRDDGVLELRANGIFVMDDAEVTSERSLARSALAEAGRRAVVLLAGLGLGHTLAEVLADPRVERIDVVEIEEAIISWMRTGVIPGRAHLLADPRVRVHALDLADFVDGHDEEYDVAILDVDNGPDQLVHAGNAALYCRAGIGAVAAMLTSGGTVAIWSAHVAEGLSSALRSVLGDVTHRRIGVRLGERDEMYHLYLATR